jgi:deazaflavin-dependent oxidoreductase (nitroreductase family)
VGAARGGISRGVAAKHRVVDRLPPPDAAAPYIYVTTTGRKTGLPREIEIWFVRWEGNLYIFAEQFGKAQWVKNILKNPRVTVRLCGRRVDATAAVLDQVRDATEWQNAQRLAREKYGWGEGLPVRLTPDDPPSRHQ